MKPIYKHIYFFLVAFFVWNTAVKAQETPADIQQEVQKLLEESFAQAKMSENQEHQPQFSQKEELPKACPVKRLDLDEILNAPPKAACSIQKQQKSRPQILVFATLSMPTNSLRAYDLALKKIGGRLVIRGLKNDSFKDTQVKMQELQISAEIDPPLFDQLAIDVAPTIILAEKQGDTYGAYDRVKGHISVEAALEIFARSGEIRGAEPLLNQLKEEKA